MKGRCVAQKRRAASVSRWRRRISCLSATLKVVAEEQQDRRDRERDRRRGAGEGAAGTEECWESTTTATLLIKSVSLGSFGVLPQDLLVEVLKRLPLCLLVQMRALSTSFDTLLRSSPLAGVHCGQPPWLVTVRISDAGPGPDLRAPRELLAYCSQLDTWFPFPSAGISSAIGDPCLLQVLPVKRDCYPVLSDLAVASAGGLMCAVVTALRPEAERRRAPPPCPPPPPMDDIDFDVDGYLSKYVYKCKDFHLMVFNGLTGASKRLPPLPPSPTKEAFLGNNVFVHMVLDASTPGTYYVVLEAASSFVTLPYRALSIYSSRTGCWMDGHATSPGGPSQGAFGDILKGDVFWYRSEHRLYWNAIPPTLFAYAIHSDSWLSIPIVGVEERGLWHYVFKWQGRVFLASTGTLMDYGFRVSVLTSSSGWSNTASWVEVARTPASLVQSYTPEVINAEVYDIKINLCGNLVCMTGSYTGLTAYHSYYLRPLVYDLTADSWYYLSPPCIKGNTTTHFGVGLFAFQPDLQATP